MRDPIALRMPPASGQRIESHGPLYPWNERPGFFTAPAAAANAVPKERRHAV